MNAAFAKLPVFEIEGFNFRTGDLDKMRMVLQAKNITASISGGTQRTCSIPETVEGPAYILPSADFESVFGGVIDASDLHSHVGSQVVGLLRSLVEALKACPFDVSWSAYEGKLYIGEDVAKTRQLLYVLDSVNWAGLEAAVAEIQPEETPALSKRESIEKDYAAGVRNFTKRDLAGVDLDGVVLAGCDFSHTSLREASLVGANLGCCTFDETLLEKADLSHATLRYSTFTRVPATKSTWYRADLRWATFGHVDFAGADLREVNAYSAFCNRLDFEGADLRASSWECAKGLLKCNWSDANTIDAGLPTKLRKAWKAEMYDSD